MEQYTLQLDKALQNGLKIDERVGSNALAFDVCTGLRPTKFGLKDYIDITQPMTDTYITTTLGQTKAYPFPQLFKGKAVTLLCFEDAIYEVDETDWTASQILLYDADDFGSSSPGDGSITPDGPWHFMDFHTTWALFNGTTSIFKTGYYSRPTATDNVTIKTGCSLKSGRAIMAGFNPDNFYALADWPAYWRTLDANAPQEIREKAAAMADGAGSNWVWWSTIGGGDLMWLISKELYTQEDIPLQNHVANGNFSSSSNWSLGTDWSITGGKLVGAGTSIFSNTEQAAANMNVPIASGISYLVSLTIGGTSSGTVTVKLGTAGSTAFTGDGPHTVTILATEDNATLSIIGNSFTGNVDDVSVTLVRADSYAGTMTPWREIMQRNEFGMCPLPWQGTVLCVKRLGEMVVAYGDGGVTALVPFSTPVATFGSRELIGLGRGIGVHSRGAVGGDQFGHIFIDSSGELWKVSPDLQADMIGYGYIFRDLLDSDIVISHDAQRNEFYISGQDAELNEHCYVLTETGLGKAPWVPTSVSFAEGGVIGMLIGDTEAGVELVTSRFGAKDRKHIDQITTVSLTTVDTDATGWSVAIDYRFSKSDGWTRTTPVVADSRGVARVNVPGLEFRVVLTHPDRTAADLDNIEVEMEHAGKKNLVGLI